MANNPAEVSLHQWSNTCCPCNKQEELEVTMLLESNDLVAITETWWGESPLACGGR